ncbi:hypothetical protein COL78_12520 [Bacillus wiedmannii]|nr:hypothetical protein COL78_12520 [Bacillus wiedmannii]
MYNFKTKQYIGEFNNQNTCAQVLDINFLGINQCLWKKKIYQSHYIFIFEEELNDGYLSELIQKAKKKFEDSYIEPFLIYNINLCTIIIRR